jgi:GntR family transcriptional regulator
MPMTVSIKIVINEISKYPIHDQIKEQIKLALSLGHIRPGDALPSIRDLGKELNVGRAVIYRAYRELQQSGIVTMQSRKGAVLSPNIVLPTTNHKAEQCAALMERVFRDVKKLGLLESSFAGLLYQRAMAQEQSSPPIAFVESIRTEALQCAAQISREWGTSVVGLSLQEFKSLKSSDIVPRWVLTPFYEYELVTRTAKRLRAEVAPVVLTFSSDFVKELISVARKGKALLLLSDLDFERHGEQLVAELKDEMGTDLSKKLTALPISQIKNVKAIAASGQYKRVYIGNRIWDSTEERIKQLPNVAHPRVEINAESLQQAKMKLGLLV